MADPDLADLSALVAVAQTRSFRAAATLRGVSASTLSEAIRRLETRLGVRLLNRTTRSVTPTEAGRLLIERLTPALAEINGALDTLNSFRDTPAGTLRLNVPTIVAQKILSPIANAFLAAYPRIALEISATDTFIDVLAAGYDAGIRYDESIERDMIAIPIGPRHQRFIAAASPAYLETHGMPSHPRDLVNHACIRHRFTRGFIPPWKFERNGQTVKITPNGPLIASTAELQVGAAIAGIGIVYTFEDFLEEELASGALVPILATWCQSFTGPRLYYPSRSHMPTPLRVFVDFIKDINKKAAA